ncbi:PepSY-associated TM helix domain-containing protein [Neptunicella sp. SCSIO 80796]|uniref:PepSY-associated TM helix domain-containing protein n=1 Tax=Neptunicella plasticusilytica TaxID=3117012 RepID=UPI003A4D2F25
MNRSFRNWYWVHKWTSLISTLFLLMLCVTGLPLIFSHEIDEVFGSAVEPVEMPGVTSQVSIDQIAAAAKQRKPKDVVQYMFQDSDEPEFWWVTMATSIDAAEASAYYVYDARTGEFIYEYPIGQGFMNLMYRLHLDMFAGLSGTLFLGAMGLLLAASLVSGVMIYGRFMARLQFGSVRKKRNQRLKWLDLHNLLGIVTLTWLMVVGVTGVINTLSVPIFGYWQNTELTRMIEGVSSDQPLANENVSVQKALDAVKQVSPDTYVSFIAFPGNSFAGPSHFGFFMNGNTPLTSKLLTPILVEARTSTVTDVGDMPWYVTALLLSQPLHYGDYGGLPLKIIWALLDILAIVVLGSGVYLWLKKRKLTAEQRFGLTEPSFNLGKTV